MVRCEVSVPGADGKRCRWYRAGRGMAHARGAEAGQAAGHAKKAVRPTLGLHFVLGPMNLPSKGAGTQSFKASIPAPPPL